MGSKNFKAHLAILGANIIYGVNYSIAKGIMPDYMTPLGLTFIRILGATLFFWLFSSFKVKEKMLPKDMIRLIIAAFFGVFLNQMLFLKGLNFTTPIDASIIMTVNPVLVLVVSAILIRERITWLKLLGIFTGAFGAIILITKGGDVDFSSQNFAGNIMMFFNALSYGVYLVLIKPLMVKYHPLTVMKYVFLTGLVFITPIGIGDFIRTDWAIIPTDIIMSIVYVVLFTTVFAYLLNIYGLKFVRPTTVSIYIYSQPIIASIVAILLGKDQLGIIQIISTLLVFAGVYMVSKPKAPDLIRKFEDQQVNK